MMNVKVLDIQHSVICHDRGQFNGHPNRGGLWDFGGGEIAVAHYQGPCAYRVVDDVLHGYYMNRSRMVLHRTLDYGATWPAEEDVEIWSRARPLEELRQWFFEGPGPEEGWDMTQPGAIFHFACEVPSGYAGRNMTFSLRSLDRGRTWQQSPTKILPPPHRDAVIIANFPMARFENGVFGVGATVLNYEPSLKEAAFYITEDHGQTWDYAGKIAGEYGAGYTYVSMLQLPSGRLQSYMMRQTGEHDINNYACMAYSDDGGMSWSEPRPIVRPDGSAWVRTDRRHPAYEVTPKSAYRAPCPLRLQDGRIVVFFSRRKSPFGMGLIVSEDEGKSWTREVILRDDASCPDLGYPLATEFEDGRIFVAYYYSLDDGNGLGGTRYIAGSTLLVV